LKKTQKHSQSFCLNINLSISDKCFLKIIQIDFVKINDFEQKLKLETTSFKAGVK
jgi:hypothetical protein